MKECFVFFYVYKFWGNVFYYVIIIFNIECIFYDRKKGYEFIICYFEYVIEIFLFDGWDIEFFG